MNTPSAAPRRWFAFRLSTLLLAVWTVAAGGVIGHRWQPWDVEFETSATIAARSDDARYVLTLNPQTDEVKLLDMATDQATVLRSSPAGLRCAHVSSQLQRAVFIDNLRDELQLWRLDPLQLAGKLSVPKATRVQLMSQDRVVVLEEPEPGQCKVWQFKEPDATPALLATRVANSILTSPDGTILVFTQPHGSLIDTVANGANYWGLSGWIMTVISMQNRAVFRMDGKLSVWDLPARQQITTLPVDASRPTGTRFSRSGRYLHVITNGGGTWFDASTGIAQQETRELFFETVEASSDARYCQGGALYWHAPQQPHPVCFLDLSKRASPGEIFFLYPTASGTRVCVTEAEKGFSVWRRRHPEWWWGHFYRPEVWAGLALGCIWLVKLARRIFRRTAAA